MSSLASSAPVVETVTAETFKQAIENAEELNRPIIVVGCMRSGTTLLARAIAKLARVAYWEESGVFGDVYPVIAPLRQALRHGRCYHNHAYVAKVKLRRIRDFLQRKDWLRDLVVSLVQHAKLPDFDLKPRSTLVAVHNVALTPEEMELVGQLDRKYRRLAESDVDRTVRVMFRDFSLLAGMPQVLEKTPEHVFFLPAVFQIFPQARVCHIVRQGRAVAASWQKTFARRENSRADIRRICRQWARALQVDEQMRQSRPQGYLRVQYETLLAEPEQTLKEVLAFLEEPVTPAVLEAARQIRPTPSCWDRLAPETQRYIDACLARWAAPRAGCAGCHAPV
jgi:hypothetical protein